MADKVATITQIFTYFSDNKTNGYKLSTFKRHWDELDEVSRQQFRVGIGNGSLTY